MKEFNKRLAIFIMNMDEDFGISEETYNEITRIITSYKLKQDNSVSESIIEDVKVNNPFAEKTLVCYVDGSYNVDTKVSGSGLVYFEKGKEDNYKTECGHFNDLNNRRNTLGEVEASKKAIETAIQLGYKNIEIYYDYQGIEKWATGEWKRNNEMSIGYYNFIQEKKNIHNINISFVKVKAHTGDKFNEMADELSKRACGVL